MNTFLDLARARRSLRSYTEKLIDRKDLELCVEAACLAPSACNTQPWKFIIVDDEKVKEEVSEKVFSGAYQMNTFAKKAAAFIAVIAEKTSLPALVGGKLRNTDYRLTDTGIATSHICLQAEELGIGTCILGWFDEKELKKILGIPKGKKVALLISLGYPEEGEVKEKIIKEKTETVSFNKY